MRDADQQRPLQAISMKGIVRTSDRDGHSQKHRRQQSNLRHFDFAAAQRSSQLASCLFLQTQ